MVVEARDDVDGDVVIAAAVDMKVEEHAVDGKKGEVTQAGTEAQQELLDTASDLLQLVTSLRGVLQDNFRYHLPEEWTERIAKHTELLQARTP